MITHRTFIRGIIAALTLSTPAAAMAGPGPCPTSSSDPAVPPPYVYGSDAWQTCMADAAYTLASDAAVRSVENESSIVYAHYLIDEIDARVAALEARVRDLEISDGVQRDQIRDLFVDVSWNSFWGDRERTRLEDRIGELEVWQIMHAETTETRQDGLIDDVTARMTAMEQRVGEFDFVTLQQDVSALDTWAFGIPETDFGGASAWLSNLSFFTTGESGYLLGWGPTIPEQFADLHLQVSSIQGSLDQCVDWEAFDTFQDDVYDALAEHDDRLAVCEFGVTAGDIGVGLRRQSRTSTPTISYGPAGAGALAFELAVDTPVNVEVDLRFRVSAPSMPEGMTGDIEIRIGGSAAFGEFDRDGEIVALEGLYLDRASFTRNPQAMPDVAVIIDYDNPGLGTVEIELIGGEGQRLDNGENISVGIVYDTDHGPLSRDDTGNIGARMVFDTSYRP